VASGLGREATAILSVAIALAILSSARLFKGREQEEK
jgi:putative Mg2+ transporter-C (MgtC) family protein